MSKQRHVVASAKDIPPGTRRVVTVDGRDIVILNIAGELFGILDRCPHNGGPLCKGTLTRRITSPEPGVYETPSAPELLRCPWHGWQYDVRTGQSWCEPDRARTITYSVRVTRGDDLVPGPLIAETVPVRREEDYIIVEV